VAEKEMRKKQLKESEEAIKKIRDELNRLLDTAKVKKKEPEVVRAIRRDVNERLTEARQELEKMEEAPTYVMAHGLPGEKVHVRGIDADGEVLEPADSSGRVRVRIGNATMLTDLENLVSRAEPGHPAPKPAEIKTDYLPNPGMELDIRGMTFDEAEPVVQRYIDDASNAGLETIVIIHGKGTGALRKKVQLYLDQNPRVESHRLGNWNEGSFGVSVATLKKD
ncbi:MAG TPA: hypothetical protein DEO84_09090, partial [candidate division Zixibacteria bacterium]|nr:hypothetical protein [candidate division Zixibacteria bacterium]